MTKIKFILDLIINSRKIPWKLLIGKEKLNNIWKNNIVLNERILTKYWRTEKGYRIFKDEELDNIFYNKLLSSDIITIIKEKILYFDFFKILEINKLEADEYFKIGELLDPKNNSGWIEKILHKRRKNIKLENILRSNSSLDISTALSSTQLLNTEEIVKAIKNNINWDYLITIIRNQPNILYCLSYILKLAESLPENNKNKLFLATIENRFYKLSNIQFIPYFKDYFVAYVEKGAWNKRGLHLFTTLKNLKEGESIYKVMIYWDELEDLIGATKFKILREITYKNKYKW